ncbi:MAG: hypothetical protein N2688_07700 [Burkholderiaceae bacterium]|nr:hypothetical protein [Burkholderiaceae bacterium]
MSNQTSVFLRRALAADAIVSAATALLMLFGAPLLADLLRLPETLLRFAGLALLPYVAFVAYAIRRPARGAVWTVIACNVAWAAGCAWLIASGWIAPNALGTAFVVVQAVAVLVFAELQYLGLRRPFAAA